MHVPRPLFMVGPLAVILGFSLPRAQALSCERIEDPSVLMSRARDAIGTTRAQPKSLAVRGVAPESDCQNVRERAMAMPDRFIETAQARPPCPNLIAVYGFSGTVPLWGAHYDRERADREPFSPFPIQRMPPDAAGSRLDDARRMHARWLLGWFGLPLPGADDQYEFVGPATYRGQDALLLNITGDALRAGQVWLDSRSCVPLGIITEVARHGSSTPVDQGASSPERQRWEVVFSDRRSVGGYLLPHRERHYTPADGQLRSDWTVESIAVNVDLPPALFEPQGR